MADFHRDGDTASRAHHNCSGKHSGMILGAVHAAEDPAAYCALEHPVQRRIQTAMATLTGMNSTDLKWGIDGCSAPAVLMPLVAIARAAAHIAAPDALPGELAPVIGRIRRAWAMHPDLIGGERRFETRLMQALGNEWPGAGQVWRGRHSVGCGPVSWPWRRSEVARRRRSGD